MELIDRFPFADIGTANVRETQGGYLVATPRVARTGIQIYKGHEVERPDLDDVRVYRPHDTVFNKASLATYSCKPITNDHPPEAVTADNWKQHAVGQVGEDVLRDGESIRVPMTLMDRTVINDFKSGKKQLSVGYTCALDWTAGKTPNGEVYDAIQKGIVVNHVAVVTAARGGDSLKIGDEETVIIEDGEIEMSEVRLKAITVDNLTCQMTDASAEIVQRHIQALKDSTAAAEGKLKTATDALAVANTELEKVKKAGETKDAELTTVKKQLEDSKLKPADLDKLVRDRQVCIAKAKVMLGDKLVLDGKTDADIRKQVVEAKLGDACKGWNDDKIEASFNTLSADIDIESGTQQQDGVRQIANDFSRPGSRRIDASDKAYADRSNDLNNAWKPKHVRDAEAASAQK